MGKLVELRNLKLSETYEQGMIKNKLNKCRSTFIRHDKLQTPYQRYEEEQSKIKGTSETKLTRNSRLQSMSFLKGLLKEVGSTEGKEEKMEIMRERVKSFVNPEIRFRKPSEVNRKLFDRVRGPGEILKL